MSIHSISPNISKTLCGLSKRTNHTFQQFLCIIFKAYYNKVDATIPFMMETQMDTTGQSCGSRFVACDVVCIASAVYVMVTCEFGLVFCISVSFEKGIIMKSTLDDTFLCLDYFSTWYIILMHDMYVWSNPSKQHYAGYDWYQWSKYYIML